MDLVAVATARRAIGRVLLVGKLKDEPVDAAVTTRPAPVRLVACQSEGGPFEDRSFLAGIELAEIWMTLRERRPWHYSVYAKPELFLQLDLAAMHFGYQMRSEPWDDAPQEWARYTFWRVAKGAEFTSPARPWPSAGGAT